MKDIMEELAAVHRATSRRRMSAGEGHSVLLRRTYDAEIEDVWDAITTPERIRRWFLPVTGELKLGGSYQLVGNARGKILRCEPPRDLALTWVFGPQPDDESSLVEVRLAAAGERTQLELEHTAIVPPEMWSKFGPGAVGAGWDLGLLGLSWHLEGREVDDEQRAAWVSSPEARAFIIGSSRAWGAAYEASGATAAEAAATVDNTTAFYAPEKG